MPSGVIKKTLTALAALALWVPAIPAQAAIVQHGVAATVAADYSAGAHAVIDTEPVGGPRPVTDNILPTISDISVTAHGRYFYRFERYFADNITKFDIAQPGVPLWQRSTLDPGDTVTGNPQTLVFESSLKAYLMRLNKTSAWIVNPSAATDAGFKLGELDMSAYDPGDGSVEMLSGVIAHGKLFVILQRLDAAWTPGEAYVAVFDTATDAEFDTGAGAGGLKGVKLPIKNPTSIYYLEEDGLIYISGVGQFDWSGVDPPDEYSGGIVTLDPDTYAVSMLLDDGDAADHPYGNISGLAVVSPSRLYFVGYAGWGDNTLYSFDPTARSLPRPVAGFEHTAIGPQPDQAVRDASAVPGLMNKNIVGMESGIYVDLNQMLWVCDATSAEVVILNTVDNTVDEAVGLTLSPYNVAFCTYDDAEPAVAQTSPASYGELDPAGVVAVTFDRAMDPATINQATFLVQDSSRSQVAGEITYDQAAHRATFTPAAALADGQVYAVTLTTGICDEFATALAEDYSFTFTARAASGGGGCFIGSLHGR